MKVEQISIFIENKSGRLAEVSKTLGEAGVNIRALSLADTSDFGILRLIVDRTDTAKAALKERGFTVSKTEVVAVEVPDRPLLPADTQTEPPESPPGAREAGEAPGRTDDDEAPERR